MIHPSHPFRERETGQLLDRAYASRIRQLFHPFREQTAAALAAAAVVAAVSAVSVSA
jgi:hypothetical protein